MMDWIVGLTILVICSSLRIWMDIRAERKIWKEYQDAEDTRQKYWDTVGANPWPED